MRKIPESFFAQMTAGVLRPGDVLINKDGAQTGKVAIYNGEFPFAAINEHVFLLRADLTAATSRFLYWVLIWRFTQRQIRQVITGSAQPGLGQGFVDKVTVPLPSVPDQLEICQVLDAIEAAIRASEQLVEKLRLTKRGLVRDLLQRGLDEEGEIRDPSRHSEDFVSCDGTLIPAGWQRVGLDRLVMNLDGRRIPLKQADRDRRHGPYPYFGASGVIDHIDGFLFDGEYILLGEDGENVISRQLPLAFRVSGRFWVNNHAHVFAPLPGNDIRFLTYLLEFTDYSSIVIGSAQPKLTQSGLRRLMFSVPGQGEQERIADIIEAHDRSIDDERATLAKLWLVRDGLMDDLLVRPVSTFVEEPAT